jgi:hypothetical protein
LLFYRLDFTLKAYESSWRTEQFAIKLTSRNVRIISLFWAVEFSIAPNNQIVDYFTLEGCESNRVDVLFVFQ